MRLTSVVIAAFAALVPMTSFAAGLAPQPTICVRSCWGARAPTGGISQMSGLDRAIVHHTANQGDYNTTSLEDSKANVRATQNYHMDANGWADIGYHFLTCKLGFNFEGRAGSMTSLPRGAHDGANTNSFGFNLMGYYHTPYNNVPTAEGLDGLYDLIAWRMPAAWAGPYGWPGTTYGSLGYQVGYVDSHRRVKATACPGDLLHNNYIGNDINSGAIRDEVNFRMQGGCNESTVPDAPTGLSAVAVTGNRIDLAWTDNSGSEDGFTVARSTTSGGPYSDLQTVAANAVAYSDTTVLGNTTYYYVVRARNCVGSSADSNEAGATTPDSGEYIIDNPAAAVVGSWSTGTSAGDKYGSDYRYKSGGDSGSYLQFTPGIGTSSSYAVYEWHSQGTNRTTGAQIQVNYDGGSQTVGINQQSNGGVWNLLGTFNFAAGTAGNVRITSGHTDTANVVIADAVRFVKVTTQAVHVQSITMSWVKAGSKYKSRATVHVVDAGGAPVVGAAVTGNFSGAINQTGASATTNSSGDAVITSSGSIKTGTVNFCVTGITGSGLSYDSGANVETCDSHSR